MVKVKIDRNDYHIPPDLLFNMAARINKRRSFLFVSKVLGKHLPVKPKTPLLASSLLAAKYMEEVLQYRDVHISIKINYLLEEMTTYQESKKYPALEPIILPSKTIFIGFAETATALGHGVFENFKNAFFFHTTRETMDNNMSIIDFEEEHSHATSHFCYINPCKLDNHDPIVLIDDELTTGKTVLNIITSIQKNYPRKSYTVLSLLDWRTEENIKHFIELEERLGVEINIVSLISGQIEVYDTTDERGEAQEEHQNTDLGTISYIDLSEIPMTKSPYYNHKSSANYLWQTGRFGLESIDQEYIDVLAKEIGKKLFHQRSGKNTLCLGTGEFMYLPMKIATYMGEHIYYQSTTRSPIYASKEGDYLIQSKYSFPCPDHSSIVNYFYQMEPNLYDEVFVFFEREHTNQDLKPILDQLVRLVPKVNVVTLSKGKDGVVDGYDADESIWNIL
jgi:hypothetical protein